MRHAVLGAGGVGGLVGAALARAGKPVTLIVRAEHPPRLLVESRVLGNFRVPISSARTLTEPVDVIWITVKRPQLEAALNSAPASASPSALVVPLLNGIDHVRLLQEIYGAERVAAGAMRVESERIEPGHVVQPGPFADIELAGPPAQRERLEQLRTEVAGSGLSARVAESMEGVLWSKLAVLAPMSLCGTAAGLPLGGLRIDPVWRRRLIDCSAEVRAVSAALGVPVAAGWEAMMDSAPGDMRTSMQKDVAAGRPAELDAIAGPILRAGREHSVPTPVTAELAEMVRRRSAARE